MPKGRWVVSYVFCSKYHNAFQQCKNFENRLRFDKVTENQKVGTFLRHSVYNVVWRVFPEGCAFWDVVDNTAYLGGHIPPQKKCRAWIGIFKPNSLHIKTCMLSKLLYHVLRKEYTDWVKKCIEYEVEGSRPRGRPKRTWREVVQKDCQARNLNREDAMDRSRWTKLIETGWWSGWWVGECFFWNRFTRVVPDKGL